ncbi:PAS domain-containing sensor histidine kinase [Mucilaginibacter lacusdianchii]|uniref:PAS domain-containing sensor histidine kinase n=1 Tax=Mucilaginibacter lacusdianchii TaxID=2684211 RepID=UPI00131E0EA8|nr:PAS domain-containing sensor histidine kinase [Mucilaginibacter sp. JXJ CY 39]
MDNETAEAANYIYGKGEMSNLIRSFDWSSTMLGPINTWPANLLTSVNLLLDSSFPMFIWWGKDKIQFYNNAYLKILGTGVNSKHPKALGQKGEDTWQEIWPIISPMIEGVLTTGNSVYLEDQLIPIYRNGKLDDVYWTFSYNPIRGVQGVPEGILVVCTETTRTNQLLQQNEQQLKRVMDHMAEGVGITDTSGQIIYSNPMAHQILDTNSERFPERTSNSPEWYNIHLDGTPMADSEHPTMVAMATKKPVFNYELAIERPGSRRMYLTMNAAPIIDIEGNVTGAVGLFTDITEKKELERRKDDFISVASHELKTPITSLKMALQILERLKNTPTSAALPKMIDQAGRSVDKVISLIDSLLNATRMNEGQLQLQKKTFAVIDLLRTSSSHIVANGKHEVHIECDESLQLHADEHRIEQVLINLLNNAVKYAPDSPIIYLKAEQQSEFVRISVRDTGPGIPAEKILHLFDRHYRADFSGTQYSGLGLGLYISAEIIKRHGGKIGVHSDLGKGSTFWCDLPLSVN